MKKVILSVIIATTVAAAFLLGGCSGSSGIGETGISLEEFNRIYTGMTQEKVEEIIGGSGTKISSSENDTDEYIEYVYVYRYEGEKSGYAEIEYSLKSPKEILSKIPKREVTSVTQYDLS